MSTGAIGHEAPTGGFTILPRKADHDSNLYKGAKMPFRQRLTWDGIALPAGRLPGCPASNGRLGLPMDFAEKLYAVTRIGTTVIVTDRKRAPGATLILTDLAVSTRLGCEEDFHVLSPEADP